MEALQILAARNLGSRPFSFRERTNGLEINDNIRQEPGTGKSFTLGFDDSSAFKRITFKELITFNSR